MLRARLLVPHDVTEYGVRTYHLVPLDLEFETLRL
jgi:hypothetical protein